MKHARADYDRIQDPAGLIPVDEPVLLLRGQDKAAPAAARAWVDAAADLGVSQEMLGLVIDQARAMELWGNRKVPDLPSIPDAKPTPPQLAEAVRTMAKMLNAALLEACEAGVLVELAVRTDPIWRGPMDRPVPMVRIMVDKISTEKVF